MAYVSPGIHTGTRNDILDTEVSRWTGVSRFLLKSELDFPPYSDTKDLVWDWTQGPTNVEYHLTQFFFFYSSIPENPLYLIRKRIFVPTDQIW